MRFGGDACVRLDEHGRLVWKCTRNVVGVDGLGARTLNPFEPAPR